MLNDGSPGTVRNAIASYSVYITACRIKASLHGSNDDINSNLHWKRNGLSSSVIMSELYEFIQDYMGIHDTDGITPRRFASSTDISIRYAYHTKTIHVEDMCLQGYDGGHPLVSSRYTLDTHSYANRIISYATLCDYSVPALGCTYMKSQDKRITA